MCGIVGFFDKKNQLNIQEKQALIDRMIMRVDHRGRDDRGSYVKDRLAVGHTRLSILDLSKNGAQPFFSEDKKTVLSYNGEIYNYRAINEDLKKRFHLKSNCDTETLLCGYLDEGIESLKKMNGMFAFSIFDTTKNTIIIAVDRFSIKPLYMIDTDEWFAWSSEVKSLLLLPGFKAKLNEDVLQEYLVFRQVSGEETLFKNIKRLLPAQVVEYSIEDDSVKKSIFWQLEKKSFDMANPEDSLLRKLETSIENHLLADVPVGVQLSGGVDSSLVVALAARHKSDLNTYSIGLQDSAWNEFSYSRMVAEKYKTNHHEYTFTEKEFCRALPSLTYFHDEPISHSHSVPMFFLAEHARKEVKVLVSGEGADEVFFGYRRYKNLFGTSPTKEELLFSNAFIKEEIAQKVLITSPSASYLDYRTEVLDSVKNLKLVEQVSYYDLKTYLPPLLLRQDKMGMAANLENRVPFLDYELVEFGFSLPEEYKIDTTENKILLKRLATKFLPHELIYRKKCGFAQPLEAWLRNKKGLGAYLEFFDRKNNHRPFLNYAYIQQLIEEHISGINHAEILWTLINLELWMRIFIDGINPENLISD